MLILGHLAVGYIIAGGFAGFVLGYGLQHMVARVVGKYQRFRIPLLPRAVDVDFYVSCRGWNRGCATLFANLLHHLHVIVIAEKGMGRRFEVAVEFGGVDIHEI